MYHGVTSRKNNPFNTRHTFLPDFEKQIKYLSKYAKVVPLKELYSHPDQKGDEPRVALTFDDGYKNNLKYVSPVLEKYQVPATVYVTGLFNTEHPYIWADFIQICSKYTKQNITLGNDIFIQSNGNYYKKSDGDPLLNYLKNTAPEYTTKIELYNQLADVFEKVKEQTEELWQLMSNDEILQLASSGLVTIGSHGYFHTNLGNISITEAKQEIVKSKQFLELLLGKKIDEIAYPDGSYSTEILQFAKDNGFDYQLAAEGFVSELDQTIPYLKDRFGVYQCSSWANQIFFKKKGK